MIARLYAVISVLAIVAAAGALPWTAVLPVKLTHDPEYIALSLP